MLDSDFRDLVVPDYTKAEAALSEPAVFRARTQRDLAAIAGDPQAMPTTAREFSRTERLLVRFRPTRPAARRRADGAAAQSRRQEDGRPVGEAVRAGRRRHVQTELPLAGLPAGEFIVELTMAGEGGERSS